RVSLRDPAPPRALGDVHPVPAPRHAHGARPALEHAPRGLHRRDRLRVPLLRAGDAPRQGPGRDRRGLAHGGGLGHERALPRRRGRALRAHAVAMRPRALAFPSRLDGYVARLFALSYCAAFFLVVGLFVILDMATNLDDYLAPDKAGVTPPTGQVGEFYL